MQVYNMEQLSDEWFEIRLGKITGSAIQDILTKGGGKVRNKRIFKRVAERITGKRCEESFSNRHTERGHALEDDARLVYEMETGNKIDVVGFIDLEKDFLGCSPDGLIEKDGMVEIKCKDDHTFVEQLILKEKAIEKRYISQIQIGLHISGRKWCDYVCYNPNFNKIYIYRIEKDESFINVLLQETVKANEEIDRIIKELSV